MTTADVTTTSGATTTTQPQTTGTSATGTSATVPLVDLFDQAATCGVTAELTEGPFYFDVDSIRSDIREDREGTTLRLAVRVREAGACTPIANAVVDIRHCDASGLYSGFESASLGGPGGGGDPTDEQTYLRGAQVTNRDGIVEFVTIYPGYRGRTVHIHAKVHLDGSTALTTQFFFDEAVNTDVYAQEPYVSDTGRDVFNDTDGIFDESLVLTTMPDGAGYLSLITLDVTALPTVILTLVPMRNAALALALAVVAACGATPDTSITGPVTTTVTTSPSSTTTVASSSSTTATATTDSTVLGGEPAPDFTLELGDGSNFTLSAQQRPVFMVFWAEW